MLPKGSALSLCQNTQHMTWRASWPVMAHASRSQCSGGRGRHISGFKASLAYKVISRTARAALEGGTSGPFPLHFHSLFSDRKVGLLYMEYFALEDAIGKRSHQLVKTPAGPALSRTQAKAHPPET